MSKPPVAERRRAVMLAHGDERVDDWYWLADKQDPAVRQHLEAENTYASEQLAPVMDLRDELYREIVSRIVETDLSVPVRRGPWWYYQRTEQGHNYPVHCRRPATDGESTPIDDSGAPVSDEEVLLDENKVAEGLDYLELANLAVSPDHQWLAYAVDTDGSERYQLRFRRLSGQGPDAEGEAAASQADEVVHDTYYGLAWANDNATVFYTKVDEAMRPYQLWRHTLGTEQSLDELVFTEPDQRYVLQVGRSKDAAKIFIALASTTTTETWVLSADRPTDAPMVVEPRRTGVEYGVDHHPGGVDGRGWYLIVTNDEATDFRLMMAPDESPGRANWTEVIGHRPGTRIEDVDVFSTWVAIGERLDGEARLRVARLHDDVSGGDDPFGTDLLARSWLVDSAEHPATTWEGPNPEMASTLLRYEQTSLVSPRAIFEMDVTRRDPLLLKRQPLLGDYDPAHYVTFRAWAVASDGTRVPMSVVHRVDLLADPSSRGGSPLAEPAPCLLYGYGAYEHSIDPGFSSLRLSLLDRGFVFAIAHVRGGGELGRSWYENGKLEAKENTFSDFIACAETLIEDGFTRPQLLAARGGSAGGLLIGAVANAAPELFGALVAEVPFVDCLTTMQDDSLPLTVGEWEEWGNPVADGAVYALMKRYSPYDNVAAHNPDGPVRQYPDIYATAGLNDPRVGYWEPAKWVQKLREANENNRVLLRTELGAGHGGPSGRYDAWRDEALIFAFLIDALGQMDVSPPS